MEIELKRNYGFELIFKMGNVTVSEDVEERIYPKKENGKSDFTKSPQRDISDNTIEQFVNVLDDLICYREREFDSSGLIKRLFEKLPETVASELYLKLKREYDIGE